MGSWQEIAIWMNQNASLITALATLAIAGLTFSLASENRKLRKAGSEPKVIAYLAPHPDGNGAVNFVLANIGLGPAFDVRFHLDYQPDNFANHHVMLTNNDNRMAITALPSGEKLAIMLGVGHKLFGSAADGKRLEPFTVTTEYRDLRNRKLKNETVVDISQFDGLVGLINKPALREIQGTLKKMERHLGRQARLVEVLTRIADKMTEPEDKPSQTDGGDG
jgi:hypothetical protein